jgi:hypothetical protein
MATPCDHRSSIRTVSTVFFWHYEMVAGGFAFAGSMQRAKLDQIGKISGAGGQRGTGDPPIIASA